MSRKILLTPEAAADVGCSPVSKGCVVAGGLLFGRASGVFYQMAGNAVTCCTHLCVTLEVQVFSANQLSNTCFCCLGIDSRITAVKRGTLLHSQGTSICPCVLGSRWGEAIEEQTVLLPGAEKLL